LREIQAAARRSTCPLARGARSARLPGGTAEADRGVVHLYGALGVESGRRGRRRAVLGANDV